jgi:hypothetical protein
VGPECGRTSRHSDDAPPGPACAEDAGGADGAAGAGGVPVSREDGTVDDDAVKEGRRSLGEKPEEPGALDPKLADGGGAMMEPGVATVGGTEVARLSAAESAPESEASLFADGLNQLVVAAIACRTAWRPLSNTPLAAVPVPSE